MTPKSQKSSCLLSDCTPFSFPLLTALISAHDNAGPLNPTVHSKSTSFAIWITVNFTTHKRVASIWSSKLVKFVSNAHLIYCHLFEIGSGNAVDLFLFYASSPFSLNSNIWRFSDIVSLNFTSNKFPLHSCLTISMFLLMMPHILSSGSLRRKLWSACSGRETGLQVDRFSRKRWENYSGV